VKRVLVTGATGFIGRACLAPLRARGFEVHAVHTSRPPAEGNVGVTWHRRDLLTPEGAALVAELAPTHLLHLAWYAVPGKYWTAAENLTWVRASLALHEAFVSAGGQRVVMAGSCAEYDWSHGVCREGETPLAPRTYYGACKHALETLISADATRAGVSAAWARYFFLFGPHEYPERLVSSVILSLLRGEVARCTEGTQRRDFLSVADAADATVALLDGAVTGAVNVASGEALPVREVVERVAALVGAKERVAFGALAANPSDPPLLVGDVRRLREEVGWQPRRTLDERLAETVGWWKSEGRA
jgi:nucleoside-diphosphate-sugar epimerase